jgi:hypothetical protein
MENQTATTSDNGNQNETKTTRTRAKNERKARIKTDFKSYLKEWSLFSTLTGMPNLARNKNKFIRALWISSFLAGSIYSFYLIMGLIVRFFDYGVLVKIKVVSQSPVEFPAVTFCNLYPFDRRKASNYLRDVFTNNNLSYGVNRIDPKLMVTLLKASVLANSSLSEADRREFGFGIDFMLLKCTFNGVPCNESHFVWRYDFNYGNCYTFNSGKDGQGRSVELLKVLEPGPISGLRLELFLGEENDLFLNHGV